MKEEVDTPISIFWDQVLWGRECDPRGRSDPVWGVFEEWRVERASQAGMSRCDGRCVGVTNEGCASTVRAEITGKQEHGDTDCFLSLDSVT